MKLIDRRYNWSSHTGMRGVMLGPAWGWRMSINWPTRGSRGLGLIVRVH